MNVLPWTEKYRPETSNQVCGNVLEFEQVLELGSQSTTLLLYGPSGTGKTPHGTGWMSAHRGPRYGGASCSCHNHT